MLIQAKRQQRKLNFLITQTELFAHFMARKSTGEKSTEDILSLLDDKPLELPPVSSAVNVEDDYGELKRACVAHSLFLYYTSTDPFMVSVQTVM